MDVGSIEGFRLSPQQRRLWKLQRLAEASALHAQCLIRVTGSINSIFLRRSVERVMRRHEALRTRFCSLPGVEIPIQVIQDDGSLIWEEADLRALNADKREKALAERVQWDRKLGGEIIDGEARIKALIAALSAKETILVLSMPALVGDARSLMNLVSEVCAAYENADEGSDDIVQYVQFSEWRNELIDEEDSAGRQYWKETAAAEWKEITLPLEKKARQDKSPPPEWEDIEIDQELRKEIERATHALEVSEETLLLACWQTLLLRLGGSADLKRRFDGRKYQDLAASLGLFEQSLPINLRVGDGHRFSEVLKKSEKAIRSAHSWQEYFADEQDFTSAPVADVGFDYSVWPAASASASLRFSLLDLYFNADLDKLRLSFAASPEFLRARFYFNPRRFSRIAVQLLASRFVVLLKRVVADPEALLRALDVLGEEELASLEQRSKPRPRPYPATLALESFEHWAGRTPDAVAVECGDQALSFAGLNALAEAICARLQRAEAGDGQKVVIAMERSIEMIGAILGVWKAGSAYAPLDARQPEARMAGVIRDSGAAIALSSRAVIQRVNLSDCGVPVLLVEDVAEGRAELGGSGYEPHPRNEKEALAYIIYTSGSTGKPKGVMISHASASNLMWALEEQVFERHALQRVSLNAPLAFDASVKQILQVCRGRTLVVIPEEVRLDAKLLVRYIRDKKIELLDTTPSHLCALLDAGLESRETMNGGGPQLQAALVGGEAINEELWKRLASGSLAYYNVYGPTECTVDATCELIREDSDGPNLGFALGNAGVYALDNARRLVPFGVQGELVIGGAGIARGYEDDVKRTAEKFIPDPLSGRAGARMYLTGDLGWMRADGKFEYAGRSDGQVKIRGYRVELGEIETAILRYPGVRQAAVTVRETEGGGKRLAAYLVGEGVEVPELRRRLQDHIPEYMTPGWFVLLEKMPLTSNGKLDRKALPDPEAIAGDEENAAPDDEWQTPHHEILIGVWRQTLNVDRIGLDDSFFELGGHSLLATQMMSRVKEAFGVTIPLRALFERPTVRGLGEVIQELVRVGQGVDLAPLTKAERTGDPPLSFAQQRLWFLDQLEPGGAAYNCPAAIRMKGRLEVGALERTLQEVIRRHETLRTRFPSVNGQASQRIDPAGSLFIPIIDLSELPREQIEIEAERLAKEEAGRPFDLSRGPLLRSALVRMEAEEHAALFTMHHIVSDAWSKSVLVREVAALYEAYWNGRSSPLPELPIQYADYAIWQQNWLQGETLEKQLAYWRQRLGDKPSSFELPPDRPRPAKPSYRGAHHTFELSEKLSADIRELGRGQGATMFMTLMAAFKILLNRQTGRADLLIGTAIAGRNRSEIEGLIGFFINTLVFRTDLSGSPKFTEYLAQVKKTALEAYSHQDLPFEKLVEDLQPERSVSYAPIVRVTFGLQNAPKSYLELPGLSLSALYFERDAGRYDLTLWMSEVEGRLRGVWTYMTELYDHETIETLTSRFETLLESIAAEPEARVHTFEIISEAEKARLSKKKQELKNSNRNKFKTITPKTVGVASD